MSEDDLLAVILKLSQNIGNFSPLSSVSNEPPVETGADTDESIPTTRQPPGSSGEVSSSGHTAKTDNPPDPGSDTE